MSYHRSTLFARPPKNPRFRSALEEIRVRQGYSQTDLAFEAAISRETLNRVEGRFRNGRRVGCRRDTAFLIAAALEVHVGQIFEEEESRDKG